MRIECPACGSKEYTLIQKFKAIIAEPLVCDSCKQKRVRPLGLSIFALLSMVIVQQIIDDYFWVCAISTLVVVIFELLLFELEPLSEHAIRNNRKRIAIIIGLAVLIVFVLLGGQFLFGEVLLP